MADKNQSKKTSFKDRLMQVHRFYGVEIQFLEPGNQKVQYVLECKYLGYKGNRYQYQISRQKMYVNDKELVNMMDVLAEKCMSIVYPLVLKVNFSGKIMEVENFQQIQERWLPLRKKLAQEYVGEIALDYLDRISVAVSEPEIFLKKMKRDIVFNLLIPRLFAWGTSNFEKNECILTIPHPNNSGMISFEGTQQINPYPDKNGHIVASYEGSFKNSDSLLPTFDTNGSLFLKYFLDNEDSSMIRMYGNCKIKNKENHKVEYKIVRLKERELKKT